MPDDGLRPVPIPANAGTGRLFAVSVARNLAIPNGSAVDLHQAVHNALCNAAATWSWFNHDTVAFPVTTPPGRGRPAHE
jgi:hypothetical protein